LRLAGIGWWELDPASGKLSWSDSLFRLLALPPRMFTPTLEHCWSLLAPEDLPRIQQACARLQQEGAPFDLFCRIMLADGRWRQFRVVACAQHHADGTRTIRGILQDVTDLSRIQDALNRTVERYQGILDGIEEGYAELDRHGRVVFFNRALKRMTGRSTPVLLDAHYRELLTPQSVPAARAAVRSALRSGQPTAFEGALRDRRDRQTPVEITLSPMRNPSGRITGFRCLARDITARLEAAARERETERQLWHARKMESLALIAGGVAHDFNNLLTAIQGYAELLGQENSQELREIYLDQITRQVHRAAGLTAQLTASSGGLLCQGKLVQLRLAVEAGIREAVESHASQHRVELLPAPDLPDIWCDPELARRAVANLVSNALEASPDANAPVQVKLRSERVSRVITLRCPPGMTLQPGCYQVVEITDHGPGMMEETQLHIFDPFFSTRFIGRGLGLPAALGIMRAHEGMVEVISAPGKGTTVRLWFPQERAITPTSLAPSSSVTGN